MSALLSPVTTNTAGQTSPSTSDLHMAATHAVLRAMASAAARHDRVFLADLTAALCALDGGN